MALKTLSSLARKDLLRDKGYINGAWVDAISRNTFTTRGDIKEKYEDEVADWLSEEEVSSYHTFTVPYGERFNAKRIEKLCYTRDLLLNGLGVIITLQMRAGHVKLRLVKRGEEKFPDDADEMWKKMHPEKCTKQGVKGWRAW